MWHEHHNRENDIAKKEKARLFFEAKFNEFISDINIERQKSGKSELTLEEISNIKPIFLKTIKEIIGENNL